MGTVMLLASRPLRLVDLTNSLPWAIELTQAIQSTGAPTTLWSGMAGTPAGSVVWSTAVASVVDYVAFGDTVAGNADFVRLVQKAGDFVADVLPDGLNEVIHGELTGETQIGSIVTVVNANGTNGKWSAAGAWAVGVADLVAEITGIPVIVTTATAGPMGSFGWISVVNDPADVDAASAKLAADPRYMGMLDNAGGLFEPGTTRVLARRIA
jgi:hypothetical protein